MVGSLHSSLGETDKTFEDVENTHMYAEAVNKGLLLRRAPNSIFRDTVVRLVSAPNAPSGTAYKAEHVVCTVVAKVRSPPSPLPPGFSPFRWMSHLDGSSHCVYLCR